VGPNLSLTNRNFVQFERISSKVKLEASDCNLVSFKLNHTRPDHCTNEKFFIPPERALSSGAEPSRDQVLARPEVWISRPRIFRPGHVRIPQAAHRRC